MDTQNKKSPRSQQGGDETDTDAPIYVVHLTVQKSEDVEIIERGLKLEHIKSETFTEDEYISQELAQAVDIEREALIDPIDIKQEQVEVEIDIENHGFPNTEHIKIEIDEVNFNREVTSEETVNREVFPAVKTEKSEQIDHEGHISNQYFREKRRTVKETESEKIPDMMEVLNTSRCSDSATNRGNVSVESDNECTTSDTDVGDSSRGQLTNTYVSDYCGDMLDDKLLVIRSIEHHDTGKRYNIKKGWEGSAKCTTLDASKHTDTERCRFKCDICQRRLHHSSALKAHLRTHTKEKPFECEICERRFSLKGTLNKHIRIHTKEKQFECAICERRFTDKCNLRRHLIMHTEEKPFECPICQRPFTLKSNLNKHIRIHSKEKPFECTICERRFTDKCNLSRHLRIHAEEKSIECVICQRKFNRKSNLSRHLRIHAT